MDGASRRRPRRVTFEDDATASGAGSGDKAGAHARPRGVGGGTSRAEPVRRVGRHQAAVMGVDRQEQVMLRQLRALQQGAAHGTARRSEDLTQARARIRVLEERLAEANGALRVARAASPAKSKAAGPTNASQDTTRLLRAELRITDANKELAASRERAEHLHKQVVTLQAAVAKHEEAAAAADAECKRLSEELRAEQVARTRTEEECQVLAERLRDTKVSVRLRVRAGVRGRAAPVECAGHAGASDSVVGSRRVCVLAG